MSPTHIFLIDSGVVKHGQVSFTKHDKTSIFMISGIAEKFDSHFETPEASVLCRVSPEHLSVFIRYFETTCAMLAEFEKSTKQTLRNFSATPKCNLPS